MLTPDLPPMDTTQNGSQGVQFFSLEPANHIQDEEDTLDV
jgi:hypothetical protein